MENTDNKCFEWEILSAKYPANSHTERATKYLMHQGEFDFANISSSDKVSDAAKFERKN